MPELAAPAGWVGCAGLRYQVGPDVCCCTLDRDMVVYVAGRFETHLLDPLAASALAWLQAQNTPCRLGDICCALFGSDAALDADAALADHQALRQLLGPLVLAGIVVER